MSHALLIVAIDPTADIEAAVAEQMAPFDEDDECFKDGSRWDWYSIGGRFRGALTGYEPWEDPENMMDCQTCGGTGIRPGGLQQFGREWFDANHGCNGCEGKGRRLKFSHDWKSHDGDCLQVKLLRPEKMRGAYAFLRNRRWDESSRMGWFGMETATECEIKGKDVKRCLWKDGKTEALVCSWNEDKKTWGDKFHERFIRPLDDETILVAVDYHV